MLHGTHKKGLAMVHLRNAGHRAHEVAERTRSGLAETLCSSAVSTDFTRACRRKE